VGAAGGMYTAGVQGAGMETGGRYFAVGQPATSSSRGSREFATGGGCRGSMQHRVGLGARAFWEGDELPALDQVTTVSELARGSFSIGPSVGEL
jgi:hypothetical protein